MSLSINTDRMVENFFDTFSFAGGREDCHRPRAECEFSLKIREIPSSEHIELHICFLLREVPFIDHDDDTFFLLKHFRYNVLVLLDNALDRVYQEHADISTFDSCFCSEY